MNTKRFRGLNYSLANEDNRVEYHYLPEGKEEVMAVACSGAPMIPLLAKNPGHLHCVDVSKEQILLTRFRIAALSSLDFSEYLMFWGYPPFQGPSEKLREFRKKICQKLPLADQETRAFIDHLARSCNFEDLLYSGRWERFYQRQSRFMRLVLGEEKIRCLFESKDLLAQHDYLESEFPLKKFSALLYSMSFLSSSALVLAKNRMPRKNIPESVWEVNRRIFSKLLGRLPAKENFFLQLLLKGRILKPEARLPEGDIRIFNRAKKALKAGSRVSYHCTSLHEAVSSCQKPLDFLASSNILSYLKCQENREFFTLLRANTREGSLILNRHYLTRPERSGFPGFSRTDRDYEWIAREDSLPVYELAAWVRDESAGWS